MVLSNVHCARHRLAKTHKSVSVFSSYVESFHEARRGCSLFWQLQHIPIATTALAVSELFLRLQRFLFYMRQLCWISFSTLSVILLEAPLPYCYLEALTYSYPHNVTADSSAVSNIAVIISSLIVLKNISVSSSSSSVHTPAVLGLLVYNIWCENVCSHCSFAKYTFFTACNVNFFFVFLQHIDIRERFVVLEIDVFLLFAVSVCAILRTIKTHFFLAGSWNPLFFSQEAVNRGLNMQIFFFLDP